jgi:protease-4
MKIWKWLFLLLLLLLLLALPIGLFMLGSSKPPLHKNSVLTVDLSRSVSELPSTPNLQALISGSVGHPLAAHEIAAALHAAAKDNHISGVFLHGSVSGSPATLLAVREAIAAVRAAHKPVIAYYGSMDERTLWFASAADELWMEPLGSIQIDGLATEIPYFGKLFEKYGIEVQVTRVGKYKSAVEPFMLESMSKENREQLSALLGDVQNTLFDEIAAARSLERAALDKASREEGIVRAPDALSRGWITRTGSFGEALADWKQKLKVDKDEDLEQIDLVSYAKRLDPPEPDGRGVRVIEAEGEIVDGSSSEGIGGDDLSRELRAAREDKDVAAVVLRVNSPGGSATASDVIRAEVRALRAAGKPVVVSMGNVAASGGYWISADADAIVAQPETITGSIGVFGMMPNIERLALEHGVRTEVVSTSPLAGWESMMRRKSPEQLARMQFLVDDIYTRFLDLVAQGRKLERAKVEEIAQGRVWSGRAARELGLVDELGNLDRAIALAREKAKLPQDAPVIRPRPEQSFLQELIDQALEGEPEPLAHSLDFRQAELQQLQRLLEKWTRHQGIVARLPFDVEYR